MYDRVVWRLLASMIAVALALNAQGFQDFRLRYGEPYIQRYRIDSQTSLTVRYGRSGRACAFQISPADFDVFAQPREKDLDTLAVDLIVDRFVPRYLAERDRGAVGAVSGRRVVEDFSGWQITHEYRASAVREKTIYAALIASARCSSENQPSPEQPHGATEYESVFPESVCCGVSKLEQQYGAPEYERFMVHPGLMLGVTYGKERSVKRIDIRQYSTSFNDEPYSAEKIVDAPTADRLIDEVFSPEGRKALRHSLNTITGWMLEETSTYGRAIIRRSSKPNGLEGQLLGYSVIWQ